MFLPFRDDRLWIHVKAINPGHHDVRFYWWTNLAVPLVPGTRVLAPVDYALSHEESGNVRLAFPVFDGFDGSCPLNYPSARSVFFRKPGNRKPWSVCVDGQGRGLSHVSTPTLFGRKLFTWGTGRGGKRWMEFLSENGQRRLYRDPGRRDADPAPGPSPGGRREHRVDRVHQPFRDGSRRGARRRTMRRPARPRAKWSIAACPTRRSRKWTAS